MRQKIQQLRQEILQFAEQYKSTTANFSMPENFVGRPAFLLAPMAYTGLKHGQRIAKNLDNVIAAVDDFTQEQSIYGVPRWSSTRFLENISQYPNAFAIDFACGPQARAFVKKICELSGIDRIKITKPAPPLIDNLETRPVFFISPTSFIANQHALGIASHTTNLIAAVDDDCSFDNIYGVPRWSSIEFLEKIHHYSNAVVIDFSCDAKQYTLANRICKLSKIEKIDAMLAIAHCDQYAVYEPARVYRELTLSRIDDFLNLADRLDDEFSVLTLFSNLLFRITYDRSYLLPAFATPVNEYFSAYGDASTFQLGNKEHFCDCGAFQGSIIQKFLTDSNYQYKSITAFEPDNINFQKLQEISSHHIPNFRAINKAVSSVNGTIRFMKKGTVASHASPYGDTSVITTRLDDELEQLTLLKIDIEGFEAKALAGAYRLISTQRPRIAVCVYHYAIDLLDVIAELDKMVKNYHFRLRQHSSAYYYDLVLYASPVAGSEPPPWAQ